VRIFWRVQIAVAAVAIASVAATGAPGCDSAPTLALCNGAGEPVTCTDDSSTETGSSEGCESFEDCGGNACCDGVCVLAPACPTGDGGPDASSDAGGDGG
jgi:hypothetical protein